MAPKAFFTAIFAEALEPRLLFLGLFLAILAVRSYVCKVSLPPGPRGYPLVRNALQLPFKSLYLRLAEWSKLYGPIYSLDLLGQPVVVLSSHTVATDLLDRRSNIYSDRPRMIMANEIYSDGLLLTAIGYGDVWRRQRRAAHDIFSSKAAERFHAVQTQSAAETVLRILRRPEGRENLLEESVYGWPPNAQMDHIVEHLHNWVERLAKSAIPGSHLVEIIPAMRYLPSWLAGWKRKGLEYGRKDTQFFEGLMEGVRIRMNAGDMTNCMAAQLLESGSRYGLSKKESAWTSGIMFAAGSETTTAALRFFVLAMTLYPDVMKIAQTEIDAVVGRGRAPSFADMLHLPYIQAVVKEVLRWGTVAPLAIPHRTTQDDWYEGYWIPKGTIVIPNNWALNRDPAFYPDYEVFRPERFLEKSGPTAAVYRYTHYMGHVAYGFGRRICAGMHFANQALSIMMVTILWAADIRVKLDKNGVSIMPDKSNMVDKGASIAPSPFPCEISPRFPGAQDILNATL